MSDGEYKILEVHWDNGGIPARAVGYLLQANQAEVVLAPIMIVPAVDGEAFQGDMHLDRSVITSTVILEPKGGELVKK
jgi:hypothetical protein